MSKTSILAKLKWGEFLKHIRIHLPKFRIPDFRIHIISKPPPPFLSSSNLTGSSLGSRSGILEGLLNHLETNAMIISLKNILNYWSVTRVHLAWHKPCALMMSLPWHQAPWHGRRCTIYWHLWLIPVHFQSYVGILNPVQLHIAARYIKKCPNRYSLGKSLQYDVNLAKIWFKISLYSQFKWALMGKSVMD